MWSSRLLKLLYYFGTSRISIWNFTDEHQKAELCWYGKHRLPGITNRLEMRSHKFMVWKVMIQSSYRIMGSTGSSVRVSWDLRLALCGADITPCLSQPTYLTKSEFVNANWAHNESHLIFMDLCIVDDSQGAGLGHGKRI